MFVILVFKPRFCLWNIWLFLVLDFYTFILVIGEKCDVSYLPVSEESREVAYMVSKNLFVCLSDCLSVCDEFILVQINPHYDSIQIQMN